MNTFDVMMNDIYWIFFFSKKNTESRRMIREKRVRMERRFVVSIPSFCLFISRKERREEKN